MPAAVFDSASSLTATTMSQPSSRLGFAGGDARRMQRSWRLGDAHVGHHGAALLRQAGHVEHGDALAVDVGGHAEQGADGDHAGAADAGDQDAVGLGEAAKAGAGRSAPASAPAAMARPRRTLPPCTVTMLGQKPATQE
jgi:hypothetical protein